MKNKKPNPSFGLGFSILSLDFSFYLSAKHSITITETLGFRIIVIVVSGLVKIHGAMIGNEFCKIKDLKENPD